MSRRTDRPSALEGMEVAGVGPEKGVWEAPRPPPSLPEAWLQRWEQTRVQSQLLQGPALQQEKAWMGRHSQEAGPTRRRRGEKSGGPQGTRPGASPWMLWGPGSLWGSQAEAAGPCVGGHGIPVFPASTSW